MEKQIRVKRIFDAISHRYDFLNHFLSGGIDFYWRNKALKLTRMNSSSRLLDVACGTGDFSIAAYKSGITNLVGVDLSLNMLKLFSKKRKWASGITVQTVAEYLPFRAASFSNIIVAFGVRNFYDLKEGFNSFHNVLSSGGKVTILEFRLPANKFIKKLYLFYFQKILPLIGRIISHDQEAYRYLPESVGEFDANVNLRDLLKDAGFAKVESYPLTFGIVEVVIGEKS